jgi:MOSC domain-containing protein YiiM
LPDDEVCIGDRYRIGTALFEVTQPRVTCYRVGIRTNEPQMACAPHLERAAGLLLAASCRKARWAPAMRS